jgi:hypothetical protein
MQKTTLRFASALVTSSLCIHGFLGNMAFSQEVEQALPTLNVLQTTVYPDDSRLKEVPGEIRIIRAEAMHKKVASNVALGLAFFALGGIGFNTSSKENFVGVKIEPLEDRSNLQNEIASFVGRLKKSVNAALQANPQWAEKKFEKSLLVAGGVTDLMYESLTGDEAQLYRLSTSVVVYKPREGFSFFPPPKVDCSAKSDKPLPQSEWEKDNYAMVKVEQEALYAACEKKVLASVADFF